MIYPISVSLQPHLAPYLLCAQTGKFTQSQLIIYLYILIPEAGLLEFSSASDCISVCQFGFTKKD